MKDNLSLSSERKSNLENVGFQQKLPNPVKISFLKKGSAQDKNAPNIIPEFLRNNSILNDRCALCSQFYKKSEMRGVSECQHTFCSTCLHKYCIYKIDVMEDVTCPQEGCRALLQENKSVFGQLPQRTKDKFRRNILWKQTISNPNLKLCPSESCDGVINKSRNVYKCNKCLTKYCKECELIQHSGPCDQNFQNIFKDWKRCPQCKMFIQRSKGCNHMICRCGYSFCFVCLARWSELHYDCNTNNFRFQINQIEQLACWKRIILGILIIICFPICLIVYFGLWAISIGLTSFFGFLGGPVYFYTNFIGLQNICFFIIWPIYMLVGAVLGVIVAFCLGCYILLNGLKRIVYTLRILWCFEGAQIYPRDQDLFEGMGS